jgi:hypothetical protein
MQGPQDTPVNNKVPVILLLAGCVACEQPRSPASQELRTASKEIFGHRFEVLADVDGDHRPDTLREVYWSRTFDREAAKFLADADFDTLVKRAYDLRPLVMLRRSGGRLDTLDARGSGFGLALLVNEGDLDGDGADEVGYVLDHADWSNTNTYHVLTWKKEGMRVLFTFPIWDWQLPDLPEAEREYGLIGQTGRRIRPAVDSMPAVDLVIPIRPGAAKVVGNIGESTLDTMEVRFAEGDSVRYIRPVLGPP